MGQVFLSEGHPETSPFDGRKILDQRFQFLMVQQIRLSFPDIRISQGLMNFERSCLDPLSVFIKTSVLGDLPNIDFRIEVGSKSHSVISGITIYDIQILNFIEVMFGSISGKDRRYARIESTSQNSGQSFFFKAFMVCPLPAIFEMCFIFRLVISRIQIVHSGFQTSFHNRQVLIRKSNINHNIRLE